MKRVSIKDVPFRIKFLMILFFVLFFILFFTEDINKKEVNENLLKANSYYVLTDYHKNNKFNPSSIKSNIVSYNYKEEEKLLKLYINEEEASACFLFNLETGERSNC